MIHSGQRVGIVVHDAGGAAIIFSFLELEKIFAKAFIVGPAKKIVPQALKYVASNSIDELIEDIDVLITGTSYPTKYELLAVSRAKKMGIKTISFLDSWINYRIRFEMGYVLIVPDLVVVTDDYGYEIANKELSEFNIIRCENYYKKKILLRYSDIVSKTSAKESGGTLYVTEPTSEFAKKIYGDEKYWGYDEFDGLDFFLENRYLIDQISSRLVIKTHPSEEASKYKKYDQYGVIVEAGNPESLYSLMQEVDTVIGCSTMALVVATWFEKTVFSSIPPGGKGFYLPKKNIRFLSDIVSKHEK